MIHYASGKWGLRILLKTKGSVFPKACIWATPAAVLAVVFKYLWYDVLELQGLAQASAIGTTWASFTFVLGFLVVFRTQQAYSRYWEGATLVQQARANFFNAVSTVVAFSTDNKTLKHDLEKFQHLLVRLTSMLHCVGLQTIADMDDVQFEYFNTDGIDSKALEYLAGKLDCHQKCEIVIQWIQRLVIQGHRAGIVDVPAPLLARFFQDLSQGAVHIINARNMTFIPFPFPYAQMLAALLLLHWFFTPVLSAIILQSAHASAMMTFVSVFAFWGANYIAGEIESPFGDDPNDLPLHALQKDMNKSLWILLEPCAQQPPQFVFNKSIHRRWDVMCQETFDRIPTQVSKKMRASQTWIRHSTSSSEEESEMPSLDTRQASFIGAGSLNDQLGSPPRSPSRSVRRSPTETIQEDFCMGDRYLKKRSTSSLPKLSVTSGRPVDLVNGNKDLRRDFEDCLQNLNVCFECHITRTIRELQHLQRNISFYLRPSRVDELIVPTEFRSTSAPPSSALLPVEELSTPRCSPEMSPVGLEIATPRISPRFPVTSARPGSN